MVTSSMMFAKSLSELTVSFTEFRVILAPLYPLWETVILEIAAPIGDVAVMSRSILVIDFPPILQTSTLFGGFWLPGAFQFIPLIVTS